MAPNKHCLAKEIKTYSFYTYYVSETDKTGHFNNVIIHTNNNPFILDEHGGQHTICPLFLFIDKYLLIIRFNELQ